MLGDEFWMGTEVRAQDFHQVLQHQTGKKAFLHGPGFLHGGIVMLNQEREKQTFVLKLGEYYYTEAHLRCHSINLRGFEMIYRMRKEKKLLKCKNEITLRLKW